jgi:hypothetical protein
MGELDCRRARLVYARVIEGYYRPRANNVFILVLQFMKFTEKSSSKRCGPFVMLLLRQGNDRRVSVWHQLRVFPVQRIGVSKTTCWRMVLSTPAARAV